MFTHSIIEEKRAYLSAANRYQVQNAQGLMQIMDMNLLNCPGLWEIKKKCLLAMGKFRPYRHTKLEKGIYITYYLEMKAKAESLSLDVHFPDLEVKFTRHFLIPHT